MAVVASSLALVHVFPTTQARKPCPGTVARHRPISVDNALSTMETKGRRAGKRHELKLAKLARVTSLLTQTSVLPDSIYTCPVVFTAVILTVVNVFCTVLAFKTRACAVTVIVAQSILAASTVQTWVFRTAIISVLATPWSIPLRGALTSKAAWYVFTCTPIKTSLVVLTLIIIQLAVASMVSCG